MFIYLYILRVRYDMGHAAWNKSYDDDDDFEIGTNTRLVWCVVGMQ